MALFELGSIEISRDASLALKRAHADVATFLERHQRGDWGAPDEDRERHNAWALRNNGIVRSIYRLPGSVSIMVSTAVDRAHTVLMPESAYERHEVDVREGYARWAVSYDQEKNPLIAVEGPVVEAILANLAFDTVLDAGAGTGRHALRLARQGFAVTALDVSPEMMAVARRVALAEGLPIRFCLGALEEGLPFAAACFDLAICALALCHVSDLSGAADALAHVLRPGGHLIITDFHPASVAHGWRTLTAQPEGTYLLPNVPHTRADYLAAVEGAGCTLLDVRDVPVRDIPPGYLVRHEELVHEYGDVPFCLVALAQNRISRRPHDQGSKNGQHAHKGRGSLTRRDIETGLCQLGLRRGDAVEVHSSLRSLGWVEGGADAVIDALMNVVGPEGAIVMSAYAVSPPVPLTAEERARGITWKVRILDPDAERTGMGAVADAFRRRPDVLCGTGPHRVCAWGRDADRYCHGYQYLLDVDGWVLLVGVNIHRCSSMHLAEHIEIPESITRRFALPEDLQHDYPEDEWAIGYGETPGDPWMAVCEEAARQGLVREGQIGPATCTLFRAKAVVSTYETLRRTDPYGLFGIEEQGDEARCRKR